MVEVLKQAAVGKAESEQDATYCLVASTTYHSQTKYGGGECKNKEKNFFLNKICLFGYSLLYQPGATQWQRAVGQNVSVLHQDEGDISLTPPRDPGNLESQGKFPEAVGFAPRDPREIRMKISSDKSCLVIKVIQW